MKQLMICIILLLPLIAKGQSIEFSTKLYTISGYYGPSKITGLDDDINVSFNMNNLALGLKGRYYKKNNSFIDLEMTFEFGHSTVRQDEGVNTVQVETNSQPIYRFLGGIGQSYNIEKLRFHPQLNIGFFKAVPKVVQIKRTYFNEILILKEVISYPKVLGFVFGPRLGIDYNLAKHWYFGLELDYLLQFGKQSKTSSIEVNKYSLEGTLIDSIIAITDYNHKFIGLGKIGLGWLITFRI